MLSDSHKKRIITGLILAAVLVGCLLAGGWPLRILLCVVVLVALWELYQMFWPGRANPSCKVAGYAAGLLIALGSGLWFGLDGALIIIAFASLFATMDFLVRYGRGNNNATLQGNLPLVFGLFYIPLTLQFALHMPFVEQLLVLLGAVASDTGAYYAGTTFGKHKMWPRVSPKKSWEGSIGALLTNMIVIVLFTLFFKIPGMEHVAIWQWAIVGFVLSVMSQAGDFFESAFKRSVGVKDSSNLLPGHGGILDRLDSIVFVLPAYIILKWALV